MGTHSVTVFLTSTPASRLGRVEEIGVNRATEVEVDADFPSASWAAGVFKSCGST